MSKHFAERNEYAVECSRKGLWKEARFHLEMVQERYPDNPEVLSNLAVVHIALKNYEQAAELLEQAKELAPDDKHIDVNYDNLRSYLDADRKPPTPVPTPTPMQLIPNLEQSDEEEENYG